MRRADGSTPYDDLSRCERKTCPRRRWISVSLLAATALLVGDLTPPASAQTAGEETLQALKGARKHRKRKARPIPLGVSGGNVFDFELDPPFILCNSGTLGALVMKNGELHILSNNHVLAMLNEGKKGDPITQPGLIDRRCDGREEDVVAELSGYKKLKPRKRNVVDMALASVVEGMVDETGRILKIGTPGNETLPPALGLRVQKSGRTTGITKGEVVVTETAVQVEFAAGDESQANRVIRFKKQMIVTGLTEDFGGPGDSGSVIYEDVSTCPRAVGLLFAGGEGFTAANPMAAVMKAAGKIKPRGEATLVGCTPPVTASATTAGAGSGRGFGVPRRAEILAARRAQAAHEDRVLAIRGVVGIGIGASSAEPDRAVLKILVDRPTPALLERIPDRLGSVSTEVLVTGRFRAF